MNIFLEYNLIEGVESAATQEGAKESKSKDWMFINYTFKRYFINYTFKRYIFYQLHLQKVFYQQRLQKVFLDDHHDDYDADFDILEWFCFLNHGDKFNCIDYDVNGTYINFERKFS